MIPPVKPGGWGPEFVPSAPELAQLDQLVGDRGLDSFGGDFVTGTLSLFQDPLHAGTPPKITGTVSVTEHSVMGTGPAGSLVCAGTVPTYSAGRPRVVRYSPLELVRSYPAVSGSTLSAGCAPVIDRTTGGVSQSQSLEVNGSLLYPITKPMDGSTVTSLRVYYYVQSLPASAPSAFNLALLATQLSTGVTEFVGFANTAPSSASSWYDSGSVQSIFVTTTSASGGTAYLGSTGAFLWGAGSNTLALSSWVYWVEISMTGTVVGSNPIITGIELTYTVPDERFQQ